MPTPTYDTRHSYQCNALSATHGLLCNTSMNMDFVYYTRTSRFPRLLSDSPDGKEGALDVSTYLDSSAYYGDGVEYHTVLYRS